MLWDRATGEPVHNAINWQDTRTDRLVRELAADGGQDRFKEQCGLPLATYFSAPKIRWLLDNIPGLRERAESRRRPVRHDRLVADLEPHRPPRHRRDERQPDDADEPALARLGRQLLDAFGVPRAMLPEIRSSAEVYGHAERSAGSPVASALGDQSAALFGQTCFSKGDAKCTYGTGSFLLMNTGAEPVQSTHGLLTTVGYKIGEQAATYALEGSIAVTGALVQWFRDNLEVIGQRARDRDAGALGRGQRRLLLRARLLRAVRAALAQRRARRDRGADRPTSPRVTWRARCSRPPPGRRARSSTR